jgi:hypothetical protein
MHVHETVRQDHFIQNKEIKKITKSEKFRGTSLAPFWIGLTYSNGIYSWTDNSPVTYTNWYTGKLDANRIFHVILLCSRFSEFELRQLCGYAAG